MQGVREGRLSKDILLPILRFLSIQIKTSLNSQLYFELNELHLCNRTQEMDFKVATENREITFRMIQVVRNRIIIVSVEVYQTKQ